MPFFLFFLLPCSFGVSAISFSFEVSSDFIISSFCWGISVGCISGSFLGSSSTLFCGISWDWIVEGVESSFISDLVSIGPLCFLCPFLPFLCFFAPSSFCSFTSSVIFGSSLGVSLISSVSFGSSLGLSLVSSSFGSSLGLSFVFSISIGSSLALSLLVSESLASFASFTSTIKFSSTFVCSGLVSIVSFISWDCSFISDCGFDSSCGWVFLWCFLPFFLFLELVSGAFCPTPLSSLFVSSISFGFSFSSSLTISSLGCFISCLISSFSIFWFCISSVGIIVIGISFLPGLNISFFSSSGCAFKSLLNSITSLTSEFGVLSSFVSFASSSLISSCFISSSLGISSIFISLISKLSFLFESLGSDSPKISSISTSFNSSISSFGFSSNFPNVSESPIFGESSNFSFFLFIFFKIRSK